MEATPADMAALAAETRPQDPPKLRVRDGVMRNSRDDKTILLLLLLAFIFPPIAVLCITSCDGQFALNVLLDLLTFQVGSTIHAIWVILHYGKGGRLSRGQRKKLERQRITEALEIPANTGPPQDRSQEHVGTLESPAIPVNTRPPQVHNEADADIPAYSAPGGAHDGDSKHL